jgi:O-antigen/teichoic acid export membrane protein
VLDFIRRSLALLLIPVYTRVLSQSSFGELDLILTASSALTVLIDLQFIAGFSRLYIEHWKAGEGPRFVGTTILTRISFGAVIVLLFLSLGNLGLFEVSFLPSFLANRAAWSIAVLAIPVTFAFDILLAQAQMLRFKRIFFAGAVGLTLLTTVLCVVLTALLRLGIVGVVLGQLVGLVIATGLLLVGLRREISFGFDGKTLTALAAYALPLVPGRWMSHATAYLSRFFIYASLGASENAILAITTKLAAAVGLFCVAFRTAWQPLAMSYIGEEGGERFYVRSLRFLLAGGIFGVASLAILCRPILAVLAPPSYGVAEYYVMAFLIAAIVGEVDANLQLGNQIAKKSYWISVAAAVAFAINLVILFALTSILGIHAAGIGLLASFVAKVIINYHSSQRSHRIDYDKRAILMFTFACTALLVLSLMRGVGTMGDLWFYFITAMIGMTMPWLTLAAADRQAAKMGIGELVSRFFAERAARSS